MKTLFCDTVPNFPGLVIGVHHTTEPASDADVEAMVRLLLEVDKKGTPVRQIVFSDGPALTAKQRKLVGEAGKQAKAHLVAIISPSSFVRGVMTALAWAGGNLRPFSPDNVAKAVAYLGYPPDALGAIREECRAAEVALGVQVRSTRNV